MRAVNLIPADQRSGSSVGVGRSQGGAYAVLALLAGVAVLAALYGSSHHQISSSRAQLATLSARSQQAQAEAARLAPYTSFIAMREARLKAVGTLVDSRFDWAHAFHELGRVLPPEVSVSSLSGTVGSANSTATLGSSRAGGSGGSVASVTPPGSVPSFSLAGCATSQAMVALTLERLRLIDGVSNVSLQSSTKGAASGGASGGCPPSDPAFTVQIVFSPLPTPLASAASATVVSAPSSPSPAPSAPSLKGAAR